MKYFSTFSGIGGFELGIQLAYESNLKHASLSEKSKSQKRTQGRVRTADKHEVLLHPGNRSAPLCVGYSEIDKYATQIYQRHFPNHKNYGDITKIVADELPDFDLLVGGFPCQAFSIAGKRGGFEDTRGTMFFELARILRTKQPQLCVFENVKGLLSHDGGKSFATIIQTLDELGYDLQWQVLNSKNHGVPQNRERVFIIGHLRGTPRPEVFPFGQDDQLLDGKIDTDKRQSQTEVSHTLRGSAVKADQSFIIHNIYGGFKESEPRVFSDTAPTIRTSAGGGHLPSVLKNSKIRRLTPTERERLQGFPDGWTKYGGYKKAADIIAKNPEHGDAFEIISDTQRYKTLGNAVTVNVIRDIFMHIL